MGIFKRSASEEAKSFDNMRDTMLYNIWLAGLGAYGKSIDEVNQLSGKSRTLFDELLERGREMDERNKEHSFAAQSKTAAAFESRLHQLVQKVTGLDSNKLEKVDDKLDHLTSQVEQLLKASQEEKPAESKVVEFKPEEKAEAPAAEPAKKPRTRKTTTRRKTTSRKTTKSSDTPVSQ